MTVIHNNTEWQVLSIFKSISNGSPEYLLKRKSDALITVKHSSKCQVIDDGQGKFIEKTSTEVDMP